MAEVGAVGDTAEVAVKLARKVEAERGSGPSACRELRYALLSLGVADLTPYRALMAEVKAAIDRSGQNLPSLAMQLRETEQTVVRLAGEPRNSAALRAAEAAVAEYEGLWEDAYGRWMAGEVSLTVGHRDAGQRCWRAFEDAGGEAVFPALAERMRDAFQGYWTRRRAVARARDGVSLRRSGHMRDGVSAGR